MNAFKKIVMSMGIKLHNKLPNELGNEGMRQLKKY
jgi:hypothetical protein